MMGDRWLQAEAAIAKCQERLDQLMKNEVEWPKQPRNHDASPALKPVKYKAGKRVPWDIKLPQDKGVNSIDIKFQIDYNVCPKSWCRVPFYLKGVSL